MKKIKVLFIAVILLSAGTSFQQVVAQEKTKAEQEKAKEDALQAQKERQIINEKNQKDLLIDVQAADPAGDQFRILNRRGSRSSSGVDPFVFSYGNGDSFYGHSFGGDEERTTWDFSKSLKENTYSRDYSFDVEKTVKSVVMSVMGDCKAGDIRIKIIMPGGKSYSDILIDESGNLNWRKSFNITETENQDKTGDWKFQIASNKATGFFKISLQTY